MKWSHRAWVGVVIVVLGVVALVLPWETWRSSNQHVIGGIKDVWSGEEFSTPADQEDSEDPVEHQEYLDNQVFDIRTMFSRIAGTPMNGSVTDEFRTEVFDPQDIEAIDSVMLQRGAGFVTDHDKKECKVLLEESLLSHGWKPSGSHESDSELLYWKKEGIWQWVEIQIYEAIGKTGISVILWE